jgi:hypothetical protein
MAWTKRSDSLSKKHYRAVRNGSGASRVNRYPLRAVVGHIPYPPHPEYEKPVTLLECGHYLIPRDSGTDAIGHKRRCHKCASGEPADGAVKCEDCGRLIPDEANGRCYHCAPITRDEWEAIARYSADAAELE